mmetsp:Transcript_99208/g.318341  ORF Transcript_99208/g.318341 Transcript_99208/m.318341 type:complete len:167 (-) Transcript_99208:32-532(-)
MSPYEVERLQDCRDCHVKCRSQGAPCHRLAPLALIQSAQCGGLNHICFGAEKVEGPVEGPRAGSIDLIQNMDSLEAGAGSNFIICSVQNRYVFGLTGFEGAKYFHSILKAALTSDVGLAMRSVVVHLKAPRLLEDHQSRNSKCIEQIVQGSPRRRIVCTDILRHHA